MEVGINSSFRRPMTAEFGMYVAFSVWSVAVFLCIFIFLRALSTVRSAIGPLRKVIGPAAIVAPAACFWIILHFQPSYFLYLRVAPWYRLLPFEESVAIICTLLYLLRWWPISIWTTLALLMIHAAIWFQSYAVTFAGGHPNLLAIPLSACASVALWGLDVRRGYSQEP